MVHDPKNSIDRTEPVPEVLANNAGFLLKRTASIIDEMNERALSRVKLSPRQLGLLRVVASEGPLSQQALSKRHNVDRTTLVQIIDELEERQLMSRITDERDRRSNLLYLTPRGKKTLVQAAKLADKEQAKFLEPIDESEWESLRLNLIKLINHHLSGLDSQ